MSGIFSAGGAGNVGASGSFYPVTIEDSLRFEDGSSAYLSRTPASAGNRKTWTWSGWVKRGNLGTNQSFFSSATASDDIRFTTTDTILVYGGAGLFNIQTSAKYRDVSAWYHIVVAYDSTQATSTDRIKIYVNGEQVTSFVSSTYPSLNREVGFNNSVAHAIGRRESSDNLYVDLYLADVNFIDGQALDATSFGEEKDGTWIPSTYSGSYGTNGFHLEFDGAVTDSSGNGNDWTANNISAHDYVPDSPTNNFAVMSSIHPSSSNFTISDGNLSIAKSGTGTFGLYSQSLMPTTGKWYFEACITGRGSSDRTRVGVANYNSVTGTSTIQGSYSGVEISTAAADKIFIVQNGSTTEDDTFYTPLSDNDVVRFAVDMDNGRLYVGVNGNWWDYNTAETGGDPTSGSGYVTNSTTIFNGSPMTAYSGFSAGTTTSTGQTFNFGQDSTFAGAISAGGNTDDNGIGDFKHPVPSGFLALATANLPEPTIIDGSEYFNTVLYSGTSATQSITSVNHQPDLVWIKQRGSATSHRLHDTIRGAGIRLSTDSPNGEVNDSSSFTSFDTDGFSLAGNVGAYNLLGRTYVAWNWKAGGTAVSNTDGSITSQVSANVDAGFSIVSYTGNGTGGATVGHSLGVQPDMIIVKSRDNARDWRVYHSSLGATKTLDLNTTNAVQGPNSAYWNSTEPTSSVFSIGNVTTVNGSGEDYIAYVFANTDGYLKAGSYTGNGSSDGPFVFTGFEVSWVMIKCTSTSGATDNWLIYDSSRDVYNVAGTQLIANSDGSEGVFDTMDLLSNGFKLRTNNAARNGSGETYIFLAFASTPFKFSPAR